MEQEEFIKESASRRGVPIIRDQSHNMLQEITSKFKPKNILEIGTAVGYSGILMLRASEDSFLTTIEHDDYKVEEANLNFKDAALEDRVKVICGDCNQEISLMVAESKYDKFFDMVFLDGPKAQYLNMLEALIMLTRSGGIIVADNVLFRGFVFGDKSEMPKRYKTIVKRLEQFITVCKSHPDIIENKLIDIEDGMLVLKVR